VRSCLGPATFARFAIGGGTPTYLDLRGLEDLLNLAEHTMGADLSRIGGSVEVSPGTVDPQKLGLLRSRGIDRISIGVESFDEVETAAAFRPQSTVEVERALGLIRDAGFPILNIDLIYGLPGQSVASWLRSIAQALRFGPEELYLYPLYVRPLTGLGRRGHDGDDLRQACYREARDLLTSAGYVQYSMRMFRAPHAPPDIGPPYRCQDDGMVGLGCGARSYTRALHYSSDYAVSGREVAAILAEYSARTDAAFARAEYGIRLDPDDIRRRYLIQSLLSRDGLDLKACRDRFGDDARAAFPDLAELVRLELATVDGGCLRLTPVGVEVSDAIGPWLESDRVRALRESYTWR
jgi:oxygen-independent coproporphyrinogen-3 oxidase